MGTDSPSMKRDLVNIRKVVLMLILAFFAAAPAFSQPVIDLCSSGSYLLQANGTSQVFIKIPAYRQVRVTLIWNCDPPEPGAYCGVYFVDMTSGWQYAIQWYANFFPWGVQIPQKTLGQTQGSHGDLLLVTLDACAGSIVKIECV